MANIFLDQKPDPQHIQALVTCKQAPTMAPLISLLNQVLESQQSKLLTAADPHIIYRLQGNALVLAELLQAIDESPEVLSRLRPFKGT